MAAFFFYAEDFILPLLWALVFDPDGAEAYRLGRFFRYSLLQIWEALSFSSTLSFASTGSSSFSASSAF